MTGQGQPTFVPFVSVPPAVVLVYQRHWGTVGWCPTFVSVVPAVVLTYGATVQAVVVGAVLGLLPGFYSTL